MRWLLAALVVVALMGCDSSEPSERETYQREQAEYYESDEAKSEYVNSLADAEYDREQRQNELDAMAPSLVDCDSFSIRSEAQEFFKRHGGPALDPYNLDGDDDGVPCEWGP